MIEVGDNAPEFTLPDQDDEPVSLSAFAGERVVVYFYPKAATRGCTVQARSFRDTHAEFEALDVPVLGVSLDPVPALQEFAAEEDLPFRLLSDADGAVAQAYGVYAEGTHQGQAFEIAERVTVVVGPDGVVEAVYDDVDPQSHAERVLAGIRGSESGSGSAEA